MAPRTGNTEATEPAPDRAPQRRIVVGADDSPGARAAIRYALAVAARRRAALDVVTAYPASLPWSWDPDIDAPEVAVVREAMHRGAEQLRSDAEGGLSSVKDVPLRVVVGRSTNPAAALIEESEDADLLVVGSRGRGAVRSALLGSVALHCVMGARCPVVVVHEAATGDQLPEATTAPPLEPRVVVGVDGSPESEAALAAALREAAATGATVDVVTVYSLPDFWSHEYGAAPPTAEEIRRGVEDRLTAMVDAARSGPPADVGSAVADVRVAVLDGRPVDMLLERAAGAQLLVVGSRGHGALRGLVFGSVALGCVLHGPCPVMVVHAALVPESPAAIVAEPSRV
jgi:nucleotide-binding universal stress UspA family protein